MTQRNLEILVSIAIILSLIMWNALLLYALAKVIDILLVFIN